MKPPNLDSLTGRKAAGELESRFFPDQISHVDVNSSRSSHSK
jgi:hypothetical protein